MDVTSLEDTDLICPYETPLGMGNVSRTVMIGTLTWTLVGKGGIATVASKLVSRIRETKVEVPRSGPVSWGGLSLPRIKVRKTLGEITQVMRSS